MKGTMFTPAILALLLAAGAQAAPKTLLAPAFAQGQEGVTPERAEKIALAKVGGGKVARVETKMPKRGMEYKVTVVDGDAKHSVYVDAKSGEVTNFRMGKVTKVKSDVNVSIGIDAAKAIATEMAGGGQVTRCKLDQKSSLGPIYDMRVVDGAKKHHIVIDANTGKVHKHIYR